MKIPYYTIYDTKHPSGKAHGGTAVIIRNDIKHYLHSQVNKECIQTTTVTIQTSSNYFQLSAVYVPPRHKITTQMWEEYFQDLGDKYIATGDYNSKFTLWRPRITTPRSRTPEKYIRNNNLNILSTSRPTYWPSDLSKIPDLLDFAVTKGLNTNKLKITPSLELSSGHTPIIITYRNKPILYSNPETLCNKIKWQTFKEIIESKIICNIPLKTPEHTEQAVTTLTETIQEATWTTTISEPTNRQTKIIPQDILEKIREKRKAKAKWQKHRTRENRKHLNKLAKEIKNKIKVHNNSEFTKFIETLSAHKNTNYSAIVLSKFLHPLFLTDTSPSLWLTSLSEFSNFPGDSDRAHNSVLSTIASRKCDLEITVQQSNIPARKARSLYLFLSCVR